MKTTTRTAALILLSVLAAACSGVLSSEQAAKQYYVLMPYEGSSATGIDAAGPALALSVIVIPGLDTDRILALDTDARLNRYAGGRWPDHLPEVLGSVLKRSLAASGRFSEVTLSDRPASGGWFLALEVQQFYGLQDSGGTTRSVRVALAGKLLCSGTTIAVDVTEERPVAEERLSLVVAAHQAALDAATARLLQQMAKDCG